MRVLWIHILSLNLEVGSTHLGQGPSRGGNHALRLLALSLSGRGMILTFAASLDRSATSRPASNRTLLPALLMLNPLRLNRPIRDQWSAFNSLSR
jgi:hypothetical protein